MKKYTTGLLILGVLMLGSSFLMPSKVEAGALTGTQISNVLNLLQQYGVTANTQNTIQTVLSSTNATNSTTTTNSTNGCTGGYIFNIYTGAPCPTTAAGTTSTTTSTTTSPVNPNAQYPYGTTGTTNTTTTTTTTNTTNVTATNGCTVNNQTSISAYNIVNGLPCVKVCTGVPAWNIVSNAICISNSNVVNNSTTTSIAVIYPNGGEDFNPGQTVGVKWSSVGISSTNEKVFILLNYYDANGAFVTNEKLAENITNDGGEVVKLPTTLPAGASWGKNFTVTVGIPSLATDNSDSKFNIE